MEITDIKASFAQNGNDYEINFPISGNVGCKRERKMDVKNPVKKKKTTNDFLKNGK